MIKVATIGPESSGKSTLCELLAEKFNGFYTTEYARDYLADTNGKYDIVDLDNMAQDQFDIWLDIPENTICFYDTEMINFKVWSMEKFNICSKLILGLIDAQQFDLYLVCKPDIPYVADKLREYPELIYREYLFDQYITELKNYNCSYVIIDGDYKSRYQKAVREVELKLNIKSEILLNVKHFFYGT